MPKRKAHRTLAEEVADLDDPAPKDIDPEQPDRGDSSEGSSGDDNPQAIAHYIDSGKGQLRKADVPVLGPEYTGSHISRISLFDGMIVSDDDPFLSDRSRQGGSSHASDSDEYADPDTVGGDDEEESSSYAFRGSKSGQEAAREQHTSSGTIDVQGMDKDSGGFSDMESDILETSREVDNIDGSRNGVDGTTQESEDSVDENGDLDMKDMGSLSSEDEESQPMASSSSHSSVSSPADADRAALREIIADSQKVMTSNLSKAAKFDVAKGRAIKQQRTAFDSLLNTRIRLQKALVATNSLRNAGLDSGDPTCPAVEAAEEAALKLWSTLDSLRQTLDTNNSLVKSASTPSTQTDPASSISNLWTRMQAHERQTRPQRLSTLDKWSSKTSPISTLPRANKFAAALTQQPLSAVLEQQLTFDTSLDKLVAKTQIPRSCAPLQAAAAVSSSKSTGDHAISSSYSDTIPIYDDADFYSLLLRDLLEQRSSDSQPTSNLIPGVASATIPGIKEPALRNLKKRVDTKASKGRKIRYTVHEKVQNFMAPDDRGRWGEKQREELFKGLLGMRVLREDDKAMNGDESEEEERAEEGLRLFRS